MVAPGVPGWGLGNALVNGDLLGRRRVGNAHVDGIRLQVVD